MNKEKELLGLGLMLGSACLLVWQVYAFLRYNFWTPVSVMTMLEWMSIGWALNPTDWIGLYNLLQKIPLSLTMLIVGLFVTIS